MPYRQIAERGFACVDDGAPLECLAIAAHAAGPAGRGPGGAARRRRYAPTAARFDIPDEEYAEIVGRVLRDEIGRGEGANFVIHRVFTGRPSTATR